MNNNEDLSFKIIGLLYDVYNELGFGYQEKYYGKALSLLLDKNDIKYKKELHCPIKFQNTIIGRYFIDFLIEDELVVELKIANEVHLRHFKQVIGYLKTNNLKLGLLALITTNGIKIKRIIL